MRSRSLRIVCGIGLFGGVVGLSGATGLSACSKPQAHAGFVPSQHAATPLGTYPASAIMTKEYGITKWHSFMGRSQLVITGYRADGHAARGVQVAWFPSVPGAKGHTRLLMLDGTGATLRRMVGGGKTGKLSAAQVELLNTMRYDIMVAPGSGAVMGAVAGGGPIQLRDVAWGRSMLHPLDGTPGTGPQCQEAWTDPSIDLATVSCGMGAALWWTGAGGVEAAIACTAMALEIAKAKTICNAEDAASCNTATPPACNFGGSPPSMNPPPMPQPKCDTACICANFPTSPGCNMNIGPCGYDSDCSGGEVEDLPAPTTRCR
jgi:hypothetical protein